MTPEGEPDAERYRPSREEADPAGDRAPGDQPDAEPAPRSRAARRGRDRDRRMTFTRLSRGDVLAMVAALALLLTMALDWWTTAVGESARDIEKNVLPQLNRGDSPTVSQQAAEAAETEEKNAWQADALIDRAILLLLLASAVLAIFGAWARAAGRSIGPPSPSAIATLTGLVACVLLVYRILQPPGLNAAAIVKPGAPLGLLCVGLLTLGARIATRGARARPAAPAPADTPPG